jgi:hypothetical protein
VKELPAASTSRRATFTWVSMASWSQLTATRPEVNASAHSGSYSRRSARAPRAGSSPPREAAAEATAPGIQSGMAPAIAAS